VHEEEQRVTRIVHQAEHTGEVESDARDAVGVRAVDPKAGGSDVGGRSDAKVVAVVVVAVLVTVFAAAVAVVAILVPVGGGDDGGRYRSDGGGTMVVVDGWLP